MSYHQAFEDFAVFEVYTPDNNSFAAFMPQIALHTQHRGLVVAGISKVIVTMAVNRPMTARRLNCR